MDRIDFATKEISSSALKSAKKSTRDLLWYYNKPKTSGSHFDFGSAIELYLLDKAEFAEKVIIFDESKRPFPDKNYQTKANKEWRDKFYADNSGRDKYIISKSGSESFDVIKQIAELVDMHPAADLLYADGNDYQEEFRWVCPISGLKRYCRTDLSNPTTKTIIDIKTYSDENFERACVKQDHFLQAFDQIQGAVQSGYMEDVEYYYWFAISKSEPYFVDFYSYPVGEDLKVEEIHNSTMHRLKVDLAGDPYSIPFHRTEIDRIKIPNYYK